MIARVWRTMGIATIWSLVGAGAFAQDRPAVFMHGFGAEARDWADTAARLKTTVAIEPHIPGLSWRSEFESQARDLQSSPEFLGLPASTVAVGHSNGGIVAREWSKLHRVDGVVTIGTPHRGAPILAHLISWAAFSDSTRMMLNEVLRAFTVPTNWWWVIYYVQDSLHWLSDFSVWSVANLVSSLGIQGTVPVAYQMLPGSSYLSRLNSLSNLSREAAEVPNRVGIVSVARNYYYAGPARAIVPEQADAIATAMYGAAAGLLAFGNLMLANSDPADFASTDQALSLLGLALQILSVDPYYCRLVSTLDMSLCLPNDGIVPIESQAFPGAPNLLIEGPAHKQEKQGGEDVLYQALVSYMHVPRRAATPPPAPLPLPPPAPVPNPTPTPNPNDPPTHEPVAISTGELAPHDELRPGDTVNSTNGYVHLAYQTDGNLVLYFGVDGEPWTPVWASDTAGTPAGVATMQGDGNFVVYDRDGVPLWSSDDSLGHPGAHLAVQNDGNLVIYDPDGTPLWSTDTFI